MAYGAGRSYLHLTLVLRGIKQGDSADGTLKLLGNLLGLLLGLTGCGPLRQAIGLTVILILHVQALWGQARKEVRGLETTRSSWVAEAKMPIK